MLKEISATVINKTNQDQIGQVADNFSSIQVGLSKVLSGIIKDVNQLGVIINELFTAFNQISRLNQVVEREMTQQDRQTQDIKAALAAIESQSDVFQAEVEKMAETSKILAEIYRNIDTSTRGFRVRKV